MITYRTNMMSVVQGFLGRSGNGAQEYVLLHGPKGAGKSTLVNSVVYKRCGVVRVDVSAGKETDAIIKETLKKITNLRGEFFSAEVNARRVIWWYNVLFPGLSKPLIVLHCMERSKGVSFANITGAVRNLAENYAVNVLVDSSENSVEEELFHTSRECSVAVEQLGPLDMEKFPNFTWLFQRIYSTNNDDLLRVLRMVLGGLPSSYAQLSAILENSDHGDIKKVEKVVQAFLLFKLEGARAVYEQMTAQCSDAVPLYALFEKEEKVRWVASKQPRPSPDKVLRIAATDSYLYLVPSTPQMKLFLQHKALFALDATVEARWDALVALAAHE